MSFDYLRREMKGIDGWILVLDTKGINVWCAAGKGTFGTDELVRQIKAAQLDKVVSHRKVIAPQLGAPGAAAHKVKEQTGFSVAYGPVRARDIPAFLEAGMKTTREMRAIRFDLRDRIILTPIELVGGIKYWLFISAAMLLISGIHRNGFSADLALAGGFRAGLMLFVALFCGAFLGPALLPYVPGAAFAWKGFVLGALGAGICAWAHLLPRGVDPIEILGWMLAVPALSSFITMNFTGASTYTSLSGVLKEMRVAVPMQIAGVSVGAVLWIVSRFV
jgi:hypothetical protein